MSFAITDWPKCLETVQSALDHLYKNTEIPINAQLSFRLNDISFKGFTLNDLQITAIQSTDIPQKFYEVLPPDASVEGHPLMLTIFFDLNKSGSTYSMQASGTISLNLPIPGFVEFDGRVAIEAFQFRGHVQLVLIQKVIIMSIRDYETFDLSLETRFGDELKRQLCPDQLDRFLELKVRQAVDLLKAHPIVLKR